MLTSHVMTQRSLYVLPNIPSFFFRPITVLKYSETIYCTKIASRVARTYTDRHGLKDLTHELLGVDLSKAQQSSDWAANTLSDAQKAYAASDVLHLHALRARLDTMLEREGRTHLAEACFQFLGTRAELDLSGWGDLDIFSH